MNKPLDPKTLVNPFAAPPPFSLLDVFNRVRERDLPDTRKRDLLSALTRVEEMIGLPLAQLPADLSRLRQKLEPLNPIRHGISPKTWANIRSNLLSAIESAGVTPVL